MTRFERPSRETLLPFLKMELTPQQIEARLVAPNAVTLAQAAYEPASQVWFIYDDETPVGLMALWDAGHPQADLDIADDPESVFLWRLYIAKDHQGFGHGTAALHFAIERARDMGKPRLKLSFVDHPVSAGPFYERYGFSRTGRIVDGEIEMSLDVRTP